MCDTNLHAHCPVIAMPIRLPVLLCGALLAAGCAPEAMNNRSATPFDQFINKISRDCAPIQLGQYQLANPLMGGAGNNSYNYWLDQTSRLYYQRIDSEQYRQSLTAFFGAGNDGTINCIIGNLPPR
jgi:hypothetical protein